jgi:hypothetical protein
MTTSQREITWRQDFEAALADAAREGRAVLIDFTAAPM